MGLVFYTSTNDGTAQERMRIRNDGNVGIGTNNPGRLLDVGGSGQGAIVGIKGNANNQVNIAHSSNTGWGLLLTNSDSSNNSDYHYSPSGQNKSCAVVNVNNDALHFGTNNTARMTITENGNVGINQNVTTRRKLEITDQSPGVVFHDTNVTNLAHLQ